MKVYLNSQEEECKIFEKFETVWKGIFAPDRNPEERMERRRLGQLLREKRQKEPERHRYISRGAFCSTDHHSEHVINMRNNTSTDEGLQDLSAHFQLLD